MKGKTRVLTGVICVITLLAALFMTSTAVLAYREALSEERLTQEAVESIQCYWAASNAAEGFAAEMAAKGVCGRFENSFAINGAKTLQVVVVIDETGVWVDKKISDIGE